MNQEFKQCLENHRIVAFERGKNLVSKELSIAECDLSDSRSSFGEKRFKWSTIQAYYAIFHATRALIYSRGYREKSHYCLAVALSALFVEEGRLDARAVRDFVNAMNLREAADYQAEFSEAGAGAVIAAADDFIGKAKSLLGMD